MINDFNNKNSNTKIKPVHFLIKSIAMFNGDSKNKKNVLGYISAGITIVPEDIGITLITDISKGKIEYVVIKGVRDLSIPEIAQKIENLKNNK